MDWLKTSPFGVGMSSLVFGNRRAVCEALSQTLYLVYGLSPMDPLVLSKIGCSN